MGGWISHINVNVYCPELSKQPHIGFDPPRGIDGRTSHTIVNVYGRWEKGSGIQLPIATTTPPTNPSLCCIGSNLLDLRPNAASWIGIPIQLGGWWQLQDSPTVFVYPHFGV
jgi:hypothetical protein